MDRDKSYPAFLLPPSLSCRSFCSLSLSFPLSSPLSRNLANVEYTNLLSSTAFLLICVRTYTGTGCAHRCILWPGCDHAYTWCIYTLFVSPSAVHVLLRAKAVCHEPSIAGQLIVAHLHFWKAAH